MTQRVAFPQAIEDLEYDYKLGVKATCSRVESAECCIDFFRFCLFLIHPFCRTIVTMSSVSLSPLAQSADKQLLFARLGLNEQVHKLLLVS